jgi:hypothetical protein
LRGLSANGTSRKAASNSFAIYPFNFTKKTTAMSDEIKNAGIKGYCLLFAAIGFLLFVVLVVSIYNANWNGLD